MRLFDRREHDCRTRMGRRALCPARLRQPPTVVAKAVRQSGRCNAGRHVVLAHGRKMPRRIADFVQRVRSNSGIARGPKQPGKSREIVSGVKAVCHFRFSTRPPVAEDGAALISAIGESNPQSERASPNRREVYLNLGARLALWSSSQAVANGPKSLSNSACSSASIRWRAQYSVTDQTFVSSSVSICLGSMCSVKGVSSELRDYASPAFIRTS